MLALRKRMRIRKLFGFPRNKPQRPPVPSPNVPIGFDCRAKKRLSRQILPTVALVDTGCVGSDFMLVLKSWFSEIYQKNEGQAVMENLPDHLQGWEVIFGPEDSSIKMPILGSADMNYRFYPDSITSPNFKIPPNVRDTKVLILDDSSHTMGNTNVIIPWEVMLRWGFLRPSLRRRIILTIQGWPDEVPDLATVRLNPIYASPAHLRRREQSTVE